MATGTIQKNMVLLWTNPNPSAEFAAQTISLNLSKFSFLLGVFSLNSTSSGSSVFSQFLHVGSSNLINITMNAAYGQNNYPNVASRTAVVSDTQIDFSGGSTKYSNVNTTAITANNRCVPLRIYGII